MKQITEYEIGELQNFEEKEKRLSNVKLNVHSYCRDNSSTKLILG